MNLYKKIINDVAKIVKKEINEAFDFNKVTTSLHDKNRSIYQAAREAAQKLIKISDVLHYFGIPSMRGGKDDKDKDGNAIYWFGSKKKATSQFDHCKPIDEYRNILRNGFGWKWLPYRNNELGERIVKKLNLYDKNSDDDELEIDRKYTTMLISPDNGLIYIEYEINSLYKNDTIYSFGFEIRLTGEEVYYIDTTE
jgi:hypothetical protein